MQVANMQTKCSLWPSSTLWCCMAMVALLSPASVQTSGSSCELTCNVTFDSIMDNSGGSSGDGSSNETVMCLPEYCPSSMLPKAGCMYRSRNITLSAGVVLSVDIMFTGEARSNYSYLSIIPLPESGRSPCCVRNMTAAGGCENILSLACNCSVNESTTPQPITASSPITVPSTMTTSSTPTASSSSLSTEAVIGIAVAGAVVLALLILLVIIIRRRQRVAPPPRPVTYGKTAGMNFENPAFKDPAPSSSLSPGAGNSMSMRVQRFSTILSGFGSSDSGAHSASIVVNDREHLVYKCERKIDDDVLEKVADHLSADAKFQNLMIMLKYPDLMADFQGSSGENEDGDDVLVWTCLKFWRDNTLGTFSGLARALRFLELFGPLDELKSAVDLMEEPVPKYDLKPLSAKSILSPTARNSFDILVTGPSSTLSSTFHHGDLVEDDIASSSMDAGQMSSFLNPAAEGMDDSLQPVEDGAGKERREEPLSPSSKVQTEAGRDYSHPVSGTENAHTSSSELMTAGDTANSRHRAATSQKRVASNSESVPVPLAPMAPKRVCAAKSDSGKDNDAVASTPELAGTSAIQSGSPRPTETELGVQAASKAASVTSEETENVPGVDTIDGANENSPAGTSSHTSGPGTGEKLYESVDDTTTGTYASIGEVAHDGHLKPGPPIKPYRSTISSSRPTSVRRNPDDPLYAGVDKRGSVVVTGDEDTAAGSNGDQPTTAASFSNLDNVGIEPPYAEIGTRASWAGTSESRDPTTTQSPGDVRIRSDTRNSVKTQMADLRYAEIRTRASWAGADTKGEAARKRMSNVPHDPNDPNYASVSRDKYRASCAIVSIPSSP